MVEETLGLLSDWTGQQPQQCTLTETLDPGELTMFVDDGQQLGRGLAEVDDELVYVSAFDEPAGTGTIPPWGRAQQGTTEAVHAVGARVTTTPRPPRSRVKTQLNQVIRGLFPDLWAVRVVDTVADGRVEYDLAGARWIMDVQWQTPGASMEWERARQWRLNTIADPLDFASGVSVTIPGVPLGQSMRVVYAAEPAELASPGDDFAAVTGLHAGVADLVVTAAAAHLVLGQELSRGQLATVEQSQRTEKVPVGASLAASRFLRQEYAARVASERRRLLATYPTRPHYEGV